jgi:hypothetical protein
MLMVDMSYYHIRPGSRQFLGPPLVHCKIITPASRHPYVGSSSSRWLIEDFFFLKKREQPV